MDEEKIKQAILQSLEASGQFTPQERVAIAQAFITLLQNTEFKEQMADIADKTIAKSITDASKHLP